MSAMDWFTIIYVTAGWALLCAFVVVVICTKRSQPHNGEGKT